MSQLMHHLGVSSAGYSSDIKEVIFLKKDSMGKEPIISAYVILSSARNQENGRNVKRDWIDVLW